MFTPEIKCTYEDTECCLNCAFFRQVDGHWCTYGVDSEGNEVWEEIRWPEDHKCLYWEEQ